MTPDEVPTPALNKQREAIESGEAPVVQQFLDWLLNEESDGGAGATIEVQIKLPAPDRLCDFREREAGISASRRRGHRCVGGDIYDYHGFTCTYCWRCKGTGRITSWRYSMVSLGSDSHRERLMAEFFGIDLDACERERMALLDALRASH